MDFEKAALALTNARNLADFEDGLRGAYLEGLREAVKTLKVLIKIEEGG